MTALGWLPPFGTLSGELARAAIAGVGFLLLFAVGLAAIAALTAKTGSEAGSYNALGDFTSPCQRGRKVLLQIRQVLNPYREPDQICRHRQRGPAHRGVRHFRAVADEGFHPTQAD